MNGGQQRNQRALSSRLIVRLKSGCFLWSFEVEKNLSETRDRWRKAIAFPPKQPRFIFLRCHWGFFLFAVCFGLLQCRLGRLLIRLYFKDAGAYAVLFSPLFTSSINIFNEAVTLCDGIKQNWITDRRLWRAFRMPCSQNTASHEYWAQSLW